MLWAHTNLMEWIYMLFLGCFQLLQCVRNNKLYKQQHMNCFVPQAEQLNSDGPLYPPDWTRPERKKLQMLFRAERSTYKIWFTSNNLNKGAAEHKLKRPDFIKLSSNNTTQHFQLARRWFATPHHLPFAESIAHVSLWPVTFLVINTAALDGCFKRSYWSNTASNFEVTRLPYLAQ